MTIKENCKAVWDKLTCEACPFLCHGREVNSMVEEKEAWLGKELESQA